MSKRVVLQIVVAIASQLILEYLNLSELADYSEFLFERNYHWSLQRTLRL